MANGCYLRTIYEPSAESDATAPSADIVFVHGLNPLSKDNFARATWTHPANDNFWPEVQLPAALPSCRILLFSYNSQVASDVSTNGIQQHANNLLDRLLGAREHNDNPDRPLVFVAHSMGGLVIKQALVTAKANDEYTAIRDATRALVFFAVPHRGGHGATLGNIAAKVVNALTGSARNDLVKSLEANSFFQESQAEMFKHQLEDYNILSFYEDKPTYVKYSNISTIVVSRESATLGLSGRREKVLSIDSNHSEICKFERDDDRFEPVKRNIIGLVRKACDRRVDTGREKELDEIGDILLAGNSHRRAAICGLGGVGKTQVALGFVERVRKLRPEWSVFWIPVISHAAIEQAFGRIANLLGLSVETEAQSKTKDIVSDHISQEAAGQWLIVVDNADKKELLFEPSSTKDLPLIEYLPRSKNVRVLYTTRNRELAAILAAERVVKISNMDPETGQQLLLQSLANQKTSPDNELLSALLEKVACLPLAINQAISYMNGKEVSIQSYLKLLEQSETEAVTLLSKDFIDETRYGELRNQESSNAVAKTWNISFQQIQKDEPLAAELLGFMSFLEPKGIPTSALPGFESKVAMTSALGTLLAYAFIVQQDDDTYDLHRLVHMASRNWLDSQGSTQMVALKVLNHLGNVFPVADSDNESLRCALMPHAQRIISFADQLGIEISKGTNRGSSLIACLGYSLYKDKRAEEAVIYLSRNEKLLSTILGLRDADCLTSQYMLASAYIDNGQITEAIKLLEHVTKIREHLRADHPDRLSSQHILASAYIDNGQTTEAIELLEYVTKIREHLRADHPDRLASQHQLASAYIDNGQTTEAIELLEYVTKIREHLRADHPDRLVSQDLLASAYIDNGQIIEAIKLLEHATKIREHLRADHPDRLASQHLLASAYIDNGQTTEAIELLEYVTKIREHLRADHPKRLVSQHQLASAYINDGQITKAIELLEHVTKIEEHLRADHPKRLASQHLLASAYIDNGQITKAIELLEHVTKIEEHLRADHPDRLASQHLLASAYINDGQITKAIKLLKHVTKIREHLRADHPDRLVSQDLLASAYIDNGQITEAIKLLKYVTKIEKYQRADHPNRLASQHQLASAYIINGQITEAIELLEHVTKIKEHLRADHPDRLVSQHQLASAYIDNGQVTKAIELLEHIVRIDEKLPSNRPLAARLASKRWLAYAYNKIGENAKAAEIRAQIEQDISPQLAQESEAVSAGINSKLPETKRRHRVSRWIERTLTGLKRT